MFFGVALILKAFIAFGMCQEETVEFEFLKQHLPGDSTTDINSAACVLSLSTKYFVDKNKLRGSIVIININSDASTIQKTILETIYAGKKYTVMVKDSRFFHKNASHFPEKAKNYMMILENQEELDKNIQQLKKLPTWNPHAKAIVYIQYKHQLRQETLAKNMINELRKYNLLRTIVLLDFPENLEIKAYSWEPYSDTNCGNLCEEVQLLDICKDDLIEEISTMTDLGAISDMKLCPLNVFTLVSEPYVMPPKRKKINSVYEDEYDFDLGIEINLLRMIAETTNMTLVVRYSDKTEDLGEIHANGSVSGLYEMLLNDEVDSIVGNVEINPIMRKVFDSSCSYMQDDITWCVKRAGTSLNWSNIITIFTSSTWGTTFASILVVSCLFHWLKCRENPTMTKWPTLSILMTVGMVLGWGAQFKPKKTAFRLLLFSWLLFSINLNTTYQSFLRSFLIHPKVSKQISTGEEIMYANLQVRGKDNILDHFQTIGNGSDVNAFVRKKFVVCEKFQKCVAAVRNKSQTVVVGSRMQAKYQDAYLGKGLSLLFCLDGRETIYEYGVVVLFRKWFPFVARFNRIIRSVTENGLIWKWNKEVNKHAPVVEQSDIVPLSIHHVLGPFIFLAIGSCIALVVFLVEIFVYVTTKPKKREITHRFVQ